MSSFFGRLRLAGAAALVAATLPVSGPATASHGPQVDAGPTPRAECGPGSRPELGIQGRVSAAEHESGRAAEGYTCNSELVGRFGGSSTGRGGYRTYRYTDSAGRECGYFDSTLLFPGSVLSSGTNLPGVFVLDMTDPRNPVKTANLLTPAMLSPHESMSLNHERGLLAAVMGNPATYPGWLDVYDLSEDCRFPALRSSTPIGILGHEGAFAPDGNTYYATSVFGHVTAVDLRNPLVPTIAWRSTSHRFHGLSISDDGNRLYGADLGSGRQGLTILDVSQVQARVPDPQVPEVARLTWPEVSIPQHTIPVTIGGRPFLVEVDEFSSGGRVGAARIIDIADEARPAVVSNLRLEVHEPEGRAATRGDPGTGSLQDYTGHYCGVPQREEPGIVACSFILSGLRVFDVRDPYHPKEIAYFNAPGSGTSYAMSGPDFAPERGEIWYSDGNKGFFAVRLTNGVWPFEPDTPDCTFDGPHGPAVGAHQAGTTIPVRWTMTCDGQVQTDPSIVSAIRFYEVDADGNPTGTGTTELDPSGVVYDEAKAQFVYRWQTPSTVAGTRQRLELEFSIDGSVRSGVFAFR